MAEFAPIPSASVATMMAANARRRSNERTAKRRSLTRVCMIGRPGGDACATRERREPCPRPTGAQAVVDLWITRSIGIARVLPNRPRLGRNVQFRTRSRAWAGENYDDADLNCKTAGLLPF